jgi:hypothetical protein
MNSNPDVPVAAPTAPPPVPLEATVVPPTLEQVPSAELADLRRRADRYRFLFKTIVTVTGIIVGATLIISLVALLIDM